MTLNKKEYSRLCHMTFALREAFLLTGKILQQNHARFKEDFKSENKLTETQERKQRQYNTETLHVFDMFTHQFNRAIQMFDEYSDRVASSFYDEDNDKGVREHDNIRKEAACLLRTYMRMENSYDNVEHFDIYEQSLKRLETEPNRIFEEDTINKINIQ